MPTTDTSNIDVLLATAELRHAELARTIERHDRQRATVASLESVLRSARAYERVLGALWEEQELAAREADRDLELAVDEAMDEECGCSSAPTRCATCATLETMGYGL